MRRELRLLVVEDDEVDAMALDRALRAAARRVHSRRVADGVEALQLLRASPAAFDALIVDLNLPRLGGLELLETLRVEPELRQLVVFVLSTSTDASDRRRAYDSQVAGYFVKSADPADLGRVVQALTHWWAAVQLPPPPASAVARRASPRVCAGKEELLAAEGARLGPTPWLRITQRRINTFALATGDRQWIHVDPVRAAAGPYGCTIAHGYLSLALVNLFLPELLEVRGARHGVNYGSDRVRFPAPVRVGERIRARGEIRSVQPARAGIQTLVRVELEIKGGDRPACVADTISRFYF